MRRILGPEVGARLKPIWGLDPEGEIRGAWRDVGLPRVWYMMGEFIVLAEGREGGDKTTESQLATLARSAAGNFALCRFHSKHLALREFFIQFLLSFFHTSAVFTRLWLTMAVMWHR